MSPLCVFLKLILFTGVAENLWRVYIKYKYLKYISEKYKGYKYKTLFKEENKIAKTLFLHKFVFLIEVLYLLLL